MDPDVELVLACYAAFARGDIATAVAPLTDDADWIEPASFPNGGAHRGRAEAAAYLQASYDSWQSFTSTPTAVRRGADVLVEHRLAGVLPDGTELQGYAVDVFTVVDGLVTAMHAYETLEEAEAAHPVP